MHLPTKNVPLLLGLMVTSNSVHAVQSSLQIALSPIVSPEFSAGTMDKKTSVTYLNISGSGLNLDGLGGSYIVRQANSDIAAQDFSAGLILIGGTMDTGTSSGRGELYAMSVPLGINFEYQPIKNEFASLIMFVGPTINLGVSSFKYNYENTIITSYVPFRTSTAKDTMSATTTSLLYGVQGGMQIGIKTTNFTFSPFALLQSQQGNAATSFSSAYNSGSSSVDIPAHTSISYGVEIFYHPWNTTLSSFFQESAQSGSNNNGFKSAAISLNWHF
jgi:hypothetical protein